MTLAVDSEDKLKLFGVVVTFTMAMEMLDTLDWNPGMSL